MLLDTSSDQTQTDLRQPDRVAKTQLTNENHRTATCTTRYLYCVGFTLRVEITPDFGHGQEKNAVSFQCHENHHIFDGWNPTYFW